MSLSALQQQDPVFTVLVMVGTDHHRFDRLVDWVDGWAEAQTAPVKVVFQHGSARAPRFGEGHALLPHEQLQDLMATASVLVTHGGPATICEAWRHGRRPLVVPRDPVRQEHVDGHQQRFSRRLGSQGLVLLCEERAQLEAGLDQARDDPSQVLFGAAEGRDALVAQSVGRIGELVDQLVEERAATRHGRARLPFLLRRAARSRRT